MSWALYLGRESNPHFRGNWILNPARLPIPPPRHSIGAANVKKYQCIHTNQTKKISTFATKLNQQQQSHKCLLIN